MPQAPKARQRVREAEEETAQKGAYHGSPSAKAEPLYFAEEGHRVAEHRVAWILPSKKEQETPNNSWTHDVSGSDPSQESMDSLAHDRCQTRVNRDSPDGSQEVQKETL